MHFIDVYIERRCVVICDAKNLDLLGYHDVDNTKPNIIDRTFHSLSGSSANNNALGFVRFTIQRQTVTLMRITLKLLQNSYSSYL